MASSSAEPPAAPERWVYNIPVPDARPFSEATRVPKEDLGDIDRMPYYSILNGRAEDITPYLLRGTIPTATHWVPMNGVAPTDSLKCVDGYIRSHLYHITRSGGYENRPADNRMAAIILGTARAVMTANYDLRTTDLVPAETAAPVLYASVGLDGGVSYNSLLADNAPHSDILTTPLALSEEERLVVRVMMRSAQAVIPLQGLNLITEGHHYISERTRPSYKAFAAVEKQVWLPRGFKDFLEAREDKVRDLIWHKSGHPVAIRLKELAATSPKVKANLEGAKLGSAMARLPALETDVRAAQTFLKVSEAVTPIWETLGGAINTNKIKICLELIEQMPKGGRGLERPVEIGGDVTVQTRDHVLDELRKIVKSSSEKVAFAFGFYCSMIERGLTEGGTSGADTLRRAFSLKKLITECAASYTMGQELFKDYQAVKTRNRAEGTLVAPSFVLDV